MTLHTHCRGPIRVVDAPDGHDVTIEGRLDVHSVPDIRDVIHAVIVAGTGEVRLHVGSAEIGDATDSGSSSTCIVAPRAPAVVSCSSTRATARRACCVPAASSASSPRATPRLSPAPTRRP